MSGGKWNNEQRFLYSVANDLETIVMEHDKNKTDDKETQYGERFVEMIRYILPKIKTMGSILDSLDYCLSGDTSEDICVRKITDMLKVYNDEEKKKFKVCECCGRVFKNDNDMQKFCSVKCRNAYNMSKYREKKKANAKLYPVREPDENMKKLDDVLNKFKKKADEEYIR